MTFTYQQIDGQRVEVNVAAAFQRMNTAFTARWSLGLLVTSGTRTRDEQAALYDKYLEGGTLAAPPGYSNHEDDGPIGPIALDLRDAGADAGVAAGSNPRADWLRDNASTHGFRPAGYDFSQVEPWHYEYAGTIGGTAAALILEEDELSAADVEAIKDAVRRDSRARLYRNAKTRELIAIDWSCNPARILYANAGDAQAARWFDPYQIVGDSPVQAKEIADEDWATLLGLAKGTDSAYKKS